MVPLSLLPDAAAVFPMKRSQLFQCGLGDGQIGADGAVIDRSSEKGNGNSGIPHQKPGVAAHLIGKGDDPLHGEQFPVLRNLRRVDGEWLVDEDISVFSMRTTLVCRPMMRTKEVSPSVCAYT